MYIAKDIKNFYSTYDVIEVTFYIRKEKPHYTMAMFPLLIKDKYVKEIMSLRTGEILFLQEEQNHDSK